MINYIFLVSLFIIKIRYLRGKTVIDKLWIYYLQIKQLNKKIITKYNTSNLINTFSLPLVNIANVLTKAMNK